MLMSLCIFTYERIRETKRTIASVRAFNDLEIELCIVDNSISVEAKTFYNEIADKYVEATDKELWNNGFGYCKQKAVDIASNNWIIYPDPGEIWHENFIETQGLIRLIDDTHGGVPAFRVLRGDPEVVKDILAQTEIVKAIDDDNGRIFDRRVMKMMGFIHEAPMHKASGQMWAVWARNYPAIALVEHGGGKADSPEFVKRKRILYDHLIATIAKNPIFRAGTNYYWWTKYWTKVVEPRYVEVSFEEWQKVCHGEG
jgi:hypothetical protein